MTEVFQQGETVRGKHSGREYRVMFGPYGSNDAYALVPVEEGYGTSYGAHGLERVPAPVEPMEAAAMALWDRRKPAGSKEWDDLEEYSRVACRASVRAVVDAYRNAEQKREPLKRGDQLRVLDYSALRYGSVLVGATVEVRRAEPDEDNEIYVISDSGSDYLPANDEGTSWERV